MGHICGSRNLVPRFLRIRMVQIDSAWGCGCIRRDNVRACLLLCFQMLLEDSLVSQTALLAEGVTEEKKK